jgi:putative nucleotidyltransferase with HDIG domain
MSLRPNLEEQELLADTLRQADGGLMPRERLIEMLFSLGFVAAVAALWWTDPPHAVVLLPSTLCFVVMVVAARVRFDTPFGYTVATQLAFVPLLFAMPVAIVPIAVVAAMMLARVPELVSGEHPPARLIKEVGNSWFAIGPVAVFALGHVAPGDAGPLLLIGALVAQFGVDFAASTLRLSLERAATFAVQLRETWVYVVDAALSVMGLVVAEELHAVPLVALAPVAMLGILALFARERHDHMQGLIELNNAYRGTALVLGAVVEADDGYTGEHSRGVVRLALALADQLGLNAEQSRNLEFGALLHDVGKIAIPKEIINKPGKLDPHEWDIITTHTVEGQKMLDRVGGFMRDVGLIVRSHHERWDGRGYPDGLSGEAVPLEARIISCCDTWNAMRTDRPYRKKLSHEVARAELVANAGHQFDPEIVTAFLKLIEHEAPDQTPVPGIPAPPHSATPNQDPAAFNAQPLRPEHIQHPTKSTSAHRTT